MIDNTVFVASAAAIITGGVIMNAWLLASGVMLYVLLLTFGERSAKSNNQQ